MNQNSLKIIKNNTKLKRVRDRKLTRFHIRLKHPYYLYEQVLIDNIRNLTICPSAGQLRAKIKKKIRGGVKYGSRRYRIRFHENIVSLC